VLGLAAAAAGFFLSLLVFTLLFHPEHSIFASDHYYPVGYGATDSSSLHYVAQRGSLTFAGAVDRRTAYFGDAKTVEVANVSDPERPTSEGRAGVPLANDIALTEDYAYVVNNGLSVAGDASDDFGVRVIARSDSTTPQEVGALNTDGTPVSVAIAGSYAYVAEGAVRVIDVSDPARLRETGTFGEDVTEVVTSDGHAYLAGGEGLHVFDVTDPAAPRAMGALALDDSPADLAVSDDVAYVAVDDLKASEDADGVNHGLRVVDVSDPAAPEKVAVFDTPGPISGVAVNEGRACIAYAVPDEDETAFEVPDEYELLQIIDVTDPSALRPGDTFVLQDYSDAGGDVDVMDIALSGSYAYIAGWHAGLLVVELPEK